MSDNPIFSYTQRDYESSRREGLSKIPIISRGVWTDLNATDPGIVILDYVHAIADMIQYYQDHQALESFISTAKERANIFRLAEQLGYDIPSAKGATVDAVITSEYAYSTPIRIPKYTKLSTYTGIPYLTREEAYLATGAAQVIVPCVQGELSEYIYQGTGVSRFSSVENAENQYIILESMNIDTDSIEIKDNSNRVWSRVDHIVFSSNIDRCFEAKLLPDNTVRINFGDGERGVIPEVADILTIRYIVNRAEDGKIGVDHLTSIDEPLYTMLGEYARLRCTNYQPSVGGSSPQSSREITLRAPGVIKAQGRAVTLDDFVNLAISVDGVKDAVAYDINTAPDLCLHHEVKVVIIPESGVVSEGLLSSVYNYLYQRMIPPTNLQVLAPSYVPIDIEINVKLASGLVEGGVEYHVREVVESYFEQRKESLGEKFYASELIPVVQSVSGVRYVISITPNESSEVSLLSLITLGNLSIIVE